MFQERSRDFEVCLKSNVQGSLQYVVNVYHRAFETEGHDYKGLHHIGNKFARTLNNKYIKEPKAEPLSHYSWGGL